MMTAIRKGILWALFGICAVAGAASAGSGKEAGAPASQFASHRGHYFSWAAPAGWKSSETMNGITLTSPDKRESVSYAILLRSQGQATPVQFLKFMLSRLPGYANIRVASTKPLPDQASGIPGTSWKVVEAEVSYTVKGKPFRSVWTCGVNNYYGIYDASLSGYEAGAEAWSRSKASLAAMANRIAIINPRQIAGNDTLIPVAARLNTKFAGK